MIKYEEGSIDLEGSAVDILGDWFALSGILFADEDTGNEPYIKKIRLVGAVTLGQHLETLVNIINEIKERAVRFNEDPAAD